MIKTWTLQAQQLFGIVVPVAVGKTPSSLCQHPGHKQFSAAQREGKSRRNKTDNS